MKSPTLAAVALIVIRPSPILARRGTPPQSRIVAAVLTLYAGLRLAKIGPRASTTENRSNTAMVLPYRQSHELRALASPGALVLLLEFRRLLRRERPLLDRQARSAPGCLPGFALPNPGRRESLHPREWGDTGDWRGGSRRDLLHLGFPLVRRSVVDRGSASRMAVVPQGRNHDLSEMNPARRWNVLTSKHAKCRSCELVRPQVTAGWRQKE
jgi:hypothetical protein